ncbi:MAG: glycolate oxidase subunit GlcF [bacterium]
MQTHLLEDFRQSSDGKIADKILRSCVHCGFCNATCPTYQLLGDENDGPRGRIYLIKQLLEGQETGQTTQKHLDRCLTCRNCESTCPSGVEYAKLLDIGRNLVEETIPRERKEKRARLFLRKLLTHSRLFSASLTMGRAFKFAVPKTLKSKIPHKSTMGRWPEPRHPRKMLVLAGCVQPSLAPDINAAAARVLDQLGISLIVADKIGCCGAVSQHLGAQAESLDFMRQNIDQWWPFFANRAESGVEAIVTTTSACGMTIKEYAHALRDDSNYAVKASIIAEHCKDIAEVIHQEDYKKLKAAHTTNPSNTTNQPTSNKRIRQQSVKKVAWHPPCSLQHGQKITGMVEQLIDQLGYERVFVQDSHLCCGSAGTYAVLQEKIAKQLRHNKVQQLENEQPDWIVTANIGCQTHLQEGTKIPVKHWLYLIAAT